MVGFFSSRIGDYGFFLFGGWVIKVYNTWKEKKGRDMIEIEVGRGRPLGRRGGNKRKKEREDGKGSNGGFSYFRESEVIDSLLFFIYFCQVYTNTLYPIGFYT